MKTLEQIASSIKNQLKDLSDDTDIETSLLHDKIHDKRATLTEAYYRKYKKLPSGLYQTLCCLKVSCVPIICEGIDSGDSELQVEIPPLMTIAGEVFVTYFGTTDFKNNFSLLGDNAEMFSNGSLHGGNETMYVMRDLDTWVIFNEPTDGLTYVCIRGILSNPLNSPCKDTNITTTYPMPLSFVDAVERMIIEELMSPMMAVESDQKNNAKDDLPKSYHRN